MTLITKMKAGLTGRREEKTMHLFDADAREEKALCGADTSADRRRSMGGYLEDRLNETGVGIACEGCKSRAVPLAVNLARDLEAEGLLDEAQEYRELAETLGRETGQDRSGDRGARPGTSTCGRFSCSARVGPLSAGRRVGAVPNPAMCEGPSCFSGPFGRAASVRDGV